MSGNGKFLIDSNVFIEAKNFAYNFDYCKIFWDFLIALHNRGVVYSINAVKKELCVKKDPLYHWVNNELPSSFFENEISSISNYSKLMNWANTLDVHVKAKVDFASTEKADAFLIAHAMTHDFTIITHEKPSGGMPKKRIMIPDAAAIHGVKTLTLYEFLPSFAANNFSIK
ncbi:DUF4411 family protein [Rosenbergiella australiborealis]|uniref:DUF4411 family protein n=1 Tax=Rosenbergiella australiborealis TaxID=1544696 RepID=A0ABS5T381_9GAMM|nr:DUF4411 family protein [Rosenbergiella australiborealis]MBT0726796.1 DUF4411 family protein [Rosenbergiella australiborealis]